MLLFIPPAYAADGMVWSFSEGNDPGNKGRMTARLAYGAPETGKARVSGVCEARSGTGVSSASLIFGADIGNLSEGATVNLRFTGGGFNHFISGSVHGANAERNITGVRLDVRNDDRLWAALMENESIDYLVPGYTASKLKLKDGHGAIKKFIEACRSYAKALSPVSAAQAPTARAGISEKEAYEAAKELGTIEAWEAFLNNFSKGFRADLARAYLKRLGAGTNRAAPLPAPPSGTANALPSPPPAPADISLAMTSQGTCRGGQSCSVTVTATNMGGQPFTGQLVIANSVTPGGATLQGSGIAPWSCQGMGGGAVCSNFTANIPPGQSIFVPMTFSLPRKAGGQVTACASISWGGTPTASGVRDIQQALNQRGFNAGPADGRPGRKTANAIRQFQSQNGLQATGEIDLPLILALFTTPRAGDANPANDQACAGSAVIAAPVALTPKPQAQYCADGRLRKGGKCVCPPAVPVWTGKTCVPRKTRNCTGGRYYSKSRKLCLCPSSKPYWYNNRCYAGVDDCPGDSVRVGSQCIKENDPAFETKRGGAGIACPSGTFRVGTNCVQTNPAPPFTFGKKPRKGGGRNTTITTGKQTGTACPLREVMGSNGRCRCSYGLVRGRGGRCEFACVRGMINKDGGTSVRSCGCPSGLVEITKAGTGIGNQGCALPGDKTQTPIMSATSKKCPDPFMRITTSGQCDCGDLPRVGNKCVQFKDMKKYRCSDLGFSDSQATNPNVRCIPSSQKTRGKKQVCTGGAVNNIAGLCQCPSKTVWNGKKCIAQGSGQNRQQQQLQQQIACTGGRAANQNGQCVCTGGKVWRKGKCRNPKAKDILKQFIQPKAQPQQQQQQQQPQGQPQNQQNQQLQQGINNLLQQFSDIRLKRDVTHLATLSNGIRLYSFRYLWDETRHVGVMAQDLLADPNLHDAVSLHQSGYYMVDYGRLGLRMVTLEEWRMRGPESVPFMSPHDRDRAQPTALAD